MQSVVHIHMWHVTLYPLESFTDISVQENLRSSHVLLVNLELHCLKYHYSLGPLVG